MKIAVIRKVCGGGKRRLFLTQAETLGIAEAVDFVGPSRVAEHHYRTADLLVLPTLSDPFANVCLEALACGCPVMTTPENGAAEILKEGETGFVLEAEPKRATQIAARVRLFAEMPVARRSQLQRDCRVSAEPFTILRNTREHWPFWNRLKKSCRTCNFLHKVHYYDSGLAHLPV